MKSRWTRISAIVVTVGLMGVSAATAEEAAKADAKKLVNQTRCPVMGGKIDSVHFTDIQGQRVYHCCGGDCSAKLKADPDKYFQKAAAEGVLFENIQKSCPVSGEVLEDRDVYSDYEGRRIYFCCKKCQKKFAEKPQEVLKGMDVRANEKPASEDHSKHEQSSHSSGCGH